MLKNNWTYDDLLPSLFHFLYRIFSAPISFSLCFPSSPSLFFLLLMFFLKTLMSLLSMREGYHSKAQFIFTLYQIRSDQIRSVAQSCLTLCDPMNRRTPGLPVHHHLPEFTQTYVHRVGDAIQPSHPLSSPSPPAPNPFQHQSLFQ